MASSWSRRRSVLVGVAGAIIISGALAYNLLRVGKKKDKGTEVETVQVERGRVVDQLRETGRIEFVRTVEVKSTVSGEIVELLAEGGDMVEDGRILAIIEPDPNQTLQLYNKRAAVERARIDLVQMQKELVRKEELHRRHLISEEAVERARDQLEKVQNASRLALLELEILETRANIERGDGPSGIEEKLDDMRVLSPVSGVVIARPVEVGEVVVSGILSTVTGTKLFEIGDPSQMMVKADISEVDVGRMKPGQPVNIIVDTYPDTTYHGVVHRIAPMGEIRQGSSIVTFATEIRILDHEPRLRQGMSCDIDIIFAERDSTPCLPVEAVYQDFGQETRPGDKKGERGRYIVYRKDDDDFSEQEVEIGLKSDTRLEILSDLSPDVDVAADAEKMHKKVERERKEKEKKEEKEGADQEAEDETQSEEE